MDLSSSYKTSLNHVLYDCDPPTLDSNSYTRTMFTSASKAASQTNFALISTLHSVWTLELLSKDYCEGLPY